VIIEARFENEAEGERRDDPRRTLRLGVAGHFGDGGDSGVTVHNISATGLLIETASLLDEGEVFAVDLPQAGEQSAEVVWADAPMYGCRFAGQLSTAALSAAQLQSEVVEGPGPAQPVEDFGARLHRLRIERGMSLADIAARLGVSKPTVWAWEHGKSRPVEKRLSALAEALGVTPGGLEPAPSGPSEEIERSRRRIAQAYGVEPVRVRIMIEL
jgi:transcriptional regulator with XRE-family HTH domain